MENFLYVFSIDLRDFLLAKDYTLLKNDEKSNVFVFVNKPEEKFSLDEKLNNESVILSNTLIF